MEHKNILHDLVPGFLYKPITPDQWQLGGITKFAGEVLEPTGQWIRHLPPGERQFSAYLDTLGCAVFNYTNRIEILWHKLNGFYRNFSDLALYVLAGVRPPGAYPQDIAETARKMGLTDEANFPFDESIKTIDDIYAKAPKNLKELCETFLLVNEPKHDWVFMDKESIKSNLTFSPLHVAVSAWYTKEPGFYYFPEGLLPNHDSSLVGYKEDEYFLIYDSYPEGDEAVIQKYMQEFSLPRETAVFLKKIRWEEKFPGETDLRFRGKRYWLAPGLPKQVSLLTQILELWKKVVALISQAPVENSENLIQPDESLPPPAPPLPIPPKYLWGTTGEVRHSIRVMCDEAGLSYTNKNIITAVIQAESQFNPRAVSPINNNGTRDWGLCQFNDGKNYLGVPFWIGGSAEFKNTDEVLNDPEKNVRIIIREFKRGNLKWWKAYSSGAYRKYL